MERPRISTIFSIFQVNWFPKTSFSTIEPFTTYFNTFQFNEGQLGYIIQIDLQ